LFAAHPDGLLARRPALLHRRPPPPLPPRAQLEDFEIYAFERLKVLRAIEQARSRGAKPDELDAEALKLAKENGLGMDDLDKADTFRKDLVSHHILRLAFCNSEDKRRQFLAAETSLFKARLSKLTPSQVRHPARPRTHPPLAPCLLCYTPALHPPPPPPPSSPLPPQTAAFTERHGISLTPLDNDERMSLAVELRQTFEALDSAPSAADADKEEKRPKFETTEYFKVPFLQAIELVRGRKVYLRGGFAYVPRQRTVTILVNRFGVYLKGALAVANKALPALLADERLDPILKNMATAYTGPEFTKRGGASADVTPASVQGLSQEAFPLCMQHLQDTLRRDSKLKHWGRQQYGLYLKGIGLSMEDALVFWQMHFTKKMSVDDFLKQYAYNIRHNYGKEGKRADYTAYPCTRIITGAAPGADDAHGCPYRHWDVARLTSVLGGMRLPAEKLHGKEGILEAVRNKDFQVACRRQFEARFPGADSGAVGNHPNAYFEVAHAHLKAAAAAAAPPPGAAGGPAAIAGAPAAAAAAAAAAPPPPAFVAATAAAPS
jgi:DNA primase large subunit